MVNNHDPHAPLHADHLYVKKRSMIFASYEKILNHREMRAAMIRRAAKITHAALIEVTLNTPGSKKDSPLFRAVHIELLSRLLPLTESRLIHIEHSPEGPFALLATHLPPSAVKEISTSLEENSPEGRLYDIDIFHPDGAKISRNTGLRTCYICTSPAAVCARNQTHTEAELAVNIRKRIERAPSYAHMLLAESALEGETTPVIPSTLAKNQTAAITRCAQRSLAAEARLSPKPGLVDEQNSGAHNDMDLQLLISSASALGPTFEQMAEAAVTGKSDAAALFSQLRSIGRKGEQAMYRATGGVNTHKGLIFSLGLLAAAASVHSTVNGMQEFIKDLCKNLVAHDLGDVQKTAGENFTYGEKLYRTFGIAGARGEAEKGFPSVFNSYRKLKVILQTCDLTSALLQTLMELMSSFIDTNVLGRGGTKALEWMHNTAQAYLELGGVPADKDFRRLQKINDACVERNVSPGGCADTLACTIFLYYLEKEKLLS